MSTLLVCWEFPLLFGAGVELGPLNWCAVFGPAVRKLDARLVHADYGAAHDFPFLLLRAIDAGPYVENRADRRIPFRDIDALAVLADDDAVRYRPLLLGAPVASPIVKFGSIFCDPSG